MEEVRGGGILNFTAELLEDFENHLKQQITEIIDSSEAFKQTEVHINTNIALMQAFVMHK